MRAKIIYKDEDGVILVVIWKGEQENMQEILRDAKKAAELANCKLIQVEELE